VTLGDGVTLGNGVTFKTTPLQIQCHPYPVYPYSLTHIGVGCVVKPIPEWIGEPPELKDHPECRPWSEYKLAIEFVKAWIERQST